MPDPRTLAVGDRVRFVALPETWSEPGCYVHEDSREFMEALIARGRPARIAGLAEDGYPWIRARLRTEDGSVEHHEWGIYEHSGWKLVGRAKDTEPD